MTADVWVHAAFPDMPDDVPDDVLSALHYIAMLRGELTIIANTTTDPITRAYAREILRTSLKHL